MQDFRSVKLVGRKVSIIVTKKGFRVKILLDFLGTTANIYDKDTENLGLISLFYQLYTFQNATLKTKLVVSFDFADSGFEL